MSLTSSIPVLRGSHHAVSRAFYQSLGFAVVEEGGDLPRFGSFHRDAATLFVDEWLGPDGNRFRFGQDIS